MAYKGIVAEIPVGYDGLTGTLNLSQAKPAELLQATTITYENGLLEKEGGAAKYNSVAVPGAPKILAGWDFWATAALQRMVVAANDGKLYKDTGNGTFATVLATGLVMEPSYAPMFVQGGSEAAAKDRKLVYMNGSDIPQVLSADAATTYNIGNNGLAAPAAPLATLVVAAGNIDAGAHSYKVTFVNGFGETVPSAASNSVTTDGTHGQVTVSNIPTSGAIGTTARKIYRSKVAGGTWYLLTTINDNTTVTYTDNTADAGLGAVAPVTNTASTRPVDWSATNGPICGVVHEARMWCGGSASSPHTLYYSSIPDHEDFANGGTVVIYPGEGQTIVSCLSFKGGLVVWKYPLGVYYIKTTDPSPTNWTVSRITNAIGCASPMGAVLIDNDIVWVDATGNVQQLSATLQYGNLGAINLSQQSYMRPFIETNLSLTYLKKIVGAYYAAKRQLHFGWTRNGSVSNDSRLVVDFMRPEKARFRYSDRDSCPAIWLRIDSNNVPRLTVGDNIGFVWNLDQTIRSKDGAGYTARFQTPWLDFSWLDQAMSAQRKIGQFLELILDPNSGQVLVDIMWDGKVTQTLQFSAGATGTLLGEINNPLSTDFQLDAPGAGNIASFLAGPGVVSIRKRIVGSGKRFSMVVTNSNAAETFGISKALLSFSLGDERV